MFSTVKAYQYVAIRLPSDSIKIEHIVPNTNINLGKFGIFNTNSIIGRPFHLTFDILDKAEQVNGCQLRVVQAAELHADTLLEEAESALQNDGTPGADFDAYGAVTTEKSNVAIFDNPENQKLTMAEIEALKADEAGSAKDLIARILASHSQLDQKTAFSLAKYTLRKQKKYMKRFTLLPLDVSTLTDYIADEKDLSKVMEIRNEILALMCSWANVHASEANSEVEAKVDDVPSEPQSRYLVVDDTGGLVVAALAERMGILYNDSQPGGSSVPEPEDQLDPDLAGKHDEAAELHVEDGAMNDAPQHSVPFRRHKQHYHNSLATSNTLTLVHSNQQPNLNLLRYFNFDPNLSPSPTSDSPPHPLYSHLKTLSWLQLLDPDADSTYAEPPPKTSDEVRALKSNARSTYYRKRRRWSRCRAVVDEARAGGFNALVVASYTNPTSILARLVPLLAGGAQIVVYSPHVEPLTGLADAYSTARRTAFLQQITTNDKLINTPDFPLDPTLTLGVMIQTARARKWQVLPGRTHPLMMAKGGAEGFLATATRVVPVSGRIEARGQVKRRSGKQQSQTQTQTQTQQEMKDVGDDGKVEQQQQQIVLDNSSSNSNSNNGSIGDDDEAEAEAEAEVEEGEGRSKKARI